MKNKKCCGAGRRPMLRDLESRAHWLPRLRVVRNTRRSGERIDVHGALGSRRTMCRRLRIVLLGIRSTGGCMLLPRVIIIFG